MAGEPGGRPLLGGGGRDHPQLAHPLVAAGVSQHSNYREDPWGRLYRTLDLTTKIVFGSTATAQEASARIRDAHGRVRGLDHRGRRRLPGGHAVRRAHARLVMWVHATLVHTSLLIYQRYVGTLTIAEQRRYYEEQKLLGEQFGVPREHQPDTRRLQRLLRRMLEERARGHRRARGRGRRHDAARAPASWRAR